ncbi:isoquinoline 1-oxidoreductase [Albidovulum inexpectatum]|uniref:Isoquinoline 1-oxidoreductase n=1 Tax=Albidovulum inexpectatum TaxID=196587 RepID=A0A2S5JD09_9RHOB|nr:isoquinoline 1-oxidoreductase [Albidovulum inexpectatum]
MKRRTFLRAAGGGLVAMIGVGAGVWSQVPVIPKRPNPDPEAALGWIAWRDGRYTLTLPRAEMGQNIATALKQVACAELNVGWEMVDLRLHDTLVPRVKATVGSESVQLFVEPLAQACASLRDAIAAGRTEGPVTVAPRPISDLRSLRPGGLIGAAPELVQGREIVTGGSLYAADVARPGIVFGRVLRAPAAPPEVASRPLRWNAEAARSVPGFIAIVEECGPPIGKARGLGILAQRPGALDTIAEALDVTWDIGGPHPRADIPTEVDVDRRLAEGSLPHTVLDAEPEAGPWDVDLRVDIPLAAHAPIEPRAAVAEWQDGTLRVWAGTQDAFYIRDFLADAFDLSGDAVTVQSCRIGGAFGGKTICTVEAEAAALAAAAGAPVKVQWTRAQELTFAFHRPPSSHRIRARVLDGRITDWDHAQVSSHILFTAAVVPAWMQRGTDMLIGDGGVARGMAAPRVLARRALPMTRCACRCIPGRGAGWGRVRTGWPSRARWTRRHGLWAPIRWPFGSPMLPIHGWRRRSSASERSRSGTERSRPLLPKRGSAGVWPAVSTRRRAMPPPWPRSQSILVAGCGSAGSGVCMTAVS